MTTAIIPMRAARPVNVAIPGQVPGVARLQAELARVMELRRCAEQEVQAIKERAMAQDRLAVLGQVAACAAHEMNQPLFFLKIFCESMVKEAESGALPVPPEWFDEAREACRQLERIQTITRQILCHCRPETEPLTRQEVPAALERALLLMLPQMKRSGVKLSVRREAEHSPVLGSSSMLEQLFINLLQNASDALAGQDDKRVRICFTQLKRSLVIAVRDNGPGVPEAIREKIFEPFFTTKGCGQGTGLGLAIVSDIVRAHQGTIRLNTRKKTGTEFVVTLPVLRG